MARPDPAPRPPTPPGAAPAAPEPSKGDGSGARVCVGAITGPHGVRGLVKIKAFTETPEGVTAYGPPGDEAGRRIFDITLQSRAKDQWIARVKGVEDRDAAEALAGTRLYVDRAALPPPEQEDTFYHADLIGLAAVAPDGRTLGTVRAVWDFGAGDVVEIAGDGPPLLVPFTRAAVPEIDIPGGRLVVDPPATVAGEETAAEDGNGSEGDGP
ncbi:MAG: ribosome maturation factor RimM [Azospirillaceae bacterium]